MTDIIDTVIELLFLGLSMLLAFVALTTLSIAFAILISELLFNYDLLNNVIRPFFQGLL